MTDARAQAEKPGVIPLSLQRFTCGEDGRPSRILFPIRDAGNFLERSGVQGGAAGRLESVPKCFPDTEWETFWNAKTGARPALTDPEHSNLFPKLRKGSTGSRGASPNCDNPRAAGARGQLRKGANADTCLTPRPTRARAPRSDQRSGAACTGAGAPLGAGREAAPDGSARTEVVAASRCQGVKVMSRAIRRHVRYE